MPDPPGALALARWADAARHLAWHRPWDSLFDPSSPPGRWFGGGALNFTANCVDRHVGPDGGAVALHWEGEPGDRRTLSYGDLDLLVRSFATTLRRLEIRRDDRVAVHLASIPEAVVAVLACARLGAVSTVLPASLPAEPLADRLEVFAPKLVVTQDGTWRHGEAVAVKACTDEALAAQTRRTVEATVVVRRTGTPVDWFEGDLWYHELNDTPAEGAPEPLPADHPLIVHYMASHRHRPLGVVHPTAGLLLAAAEMHRLALTQGPDDVLWTPMELSFINGLVQGILGPLACGMQAVLFEGTLDTPTAARAWEIIERYRVSTLFTTPSVVRHLHRWTQGPPSQDLSSLRLVVTGGERLEEDDAAWLRTGVRPQKDLMVVNAWGQTETGGAVLFHPPPQGPDSFPDAGVDIVDGDGHAVPTGTAGEMVLRHPWPALFLNVEGHPDPTGRYCRTWPDGDSAYTTGDLVIRQPGGQLEYVRRLDSVVKVSGQLVSLDDISEAIVEHPFVEQGLAAQTLGPGGDRILLACMTLTADVSPSPELAADICRHVHESLGGLARLGAVAFVEAFPPDVPPAELRYALALVGASRSHASSFEVTTVQLREALAATRRL